MNEDLSTRLISTEQQEDHIDDMKRKRDEVGYEEEDDNDDVESGD